jgi:c-di-GMP-binding flagellar brake protein YcgR
MEDDAYPIPRRYERIPVTVPVTILVENKKGRKVPQSMRMVDVSDHGVRLRGASGLSTGQVIELIPSEGPQYAVQGRVVWGNLMSGSDEAEYGLEFLNPYPVKSWEPEGHTVKV